MGPRTECAYFKGRNLGASGWSRSGGATRRAGKLGSKKELIMVGVEKNDPLMLARQLPIKSVALILAGDVVPV